MMLLKSQETSAYRMPNKETMRVSFRDVQKVKKQRILDDLSMKQTQMQGMLSVKETKIKEKTRTRPDDKQMQDYLLNFSTAAEIVSVKELEKDNGNAMASFAHAFTAKIQANFIKDSLFEAIRNKMKQSAQQRKKLQKLGTLSTLRDKYEEYIANQKGLFCIDNEDRWNPLEKVAQMIQ